MEQGAEPKFEAPVSWGKGVYMSGRRGSLTIDRGELTLRKRDGDLVAQAPTGDVSVAKALDSVKVWIEGQKFILRPGKGAVKAPGLPTAARGASAATKQFKQFKDFAATLLAVAEAEGAHIGKPE